jgi:type IV pilus assembly protein PilV
MLMKTLHKPAKLIGTRSGHTGQQGSTLIEVLVAILILSIGLLGIAGMQVLTMRYSQGGWARAAVAANLSDIADRVRANPSASVTAYQFLTDYTTQRTAIEAGTVTAPKDCETAITCTPAELAASQIVRWRLALARDLPGGAGFISGQRDTGYVATVMWFDKSFVLDSAPTSLDWAAACDSTQTGIAGRTCCPASAASKIPGIRCTNMLVTP